MSRFHELIALKKMFAAHEGISDADVMHAAAIVGTDPDKVGTFLTELSHSRQQVGPFRKQCWQFIETAPKDGTRILLFREMAHFGLVVIVGQWKEEKGTPYWSHDAVGQFGITDARKFQPSYWMPLPQIPVDRSSTRRRSIDDLNHVGHRKHFGRH